ncbi:S8 family serine peptidase [Fluviispira multicolorata]|uniref:S8 family serine peptidase n=1 Tax=Fluviispira multicolorata TaxID=2654512 RepID=A0A833JDR4_9BACT|nr:S8 family serine peptidase [Fluviispira multicolorata]KAB8031050.1 S8 family serine peptidase [Fluviispira multicolorata]
MGLYKNCTALLSVSIVSVSFLSSCGKSTKQAEETALLNPPSFGQIGNNGGFNKGDEIVRNGTGDNQMISPAPIYEEDFNDSSDSKNTDNSNRNENEEDKNKVTKSSEKFCTDLDNTKKNPLGKYQWHLKNTGQTAFASSAGNVGEDINVASVLKKQCLSGFGVNVAVVDTGLEIDHPSLIDNVKNNKDANEREGQDLPTSKNFRDNKLSKNNPSPIASDDEDHGTMVAGIIGMRSNKGFGGSGVAPRAFLSGYNIIQQEDGVQTFQNFLDSLGGSSDSNKNHVFSMSYGDNNITQIDPEEFVTKGSLTAYSYGAKHLRGEKGAIYVKAAGNGFYKLGNEKDYIAACATALEINVSCQNSSMNTDNTMPEVITVGALNAKGTKTSYSTTGSSLWISAPGGEFGFDKEWISEQFERYGKLYDWSAKRATAGEPAIVTTDVSGSRYGMSKKVNMDNLNEVIDIRNKFNAGLIEENESYNYTNSMNGTSSATPVTSGSIALILEANPELTWRDVKYILAATATKVDPTFEGVKVNLSGGEYLAEQGWVNNAAGFHFSNYYGFGRVNVAEAVKLAKKYKLGSLGNYVERAWFPKANAYLMNIPKGEPNSSYLTLQDVKESQAVKIESVRLEVSIDSSYIGDVGIELISPSGTKSIIWNIGNAFANNGNLKAMPIQSNAFYGESNVGKWKVRIVNSGMHNANVTLKGLRIQFAGQDTSK